ncbi:WD repeat-containing protein 90 isoform X1 [Tympanuchus pallidicinctus]|uniref:WD repeat-containing protein 90 isoform X1 n=2 Tax=Tympanuchus pallidicinctus TaxID=109042 RepID=UPI002287066D|nr:WD repeat-containing protein 90 isoform X1 [Tympanuchus pallidicinctus]
MAAAWQSPYLNIFKHFRVEEWKRSHKEGDVTTVMDKTLKGTVYRIRGSIPASNYLQLPRTGSQSLGLCGRYLYLLFRPLPRKYFVVHLDVATEENLVVRVSFSNLFKEFKSTATWLQFPFICGAAKGSLRDSTARASRQGSLSADLVGAAPANARWTCLVLDLHYVLSLYLSRRYSHLRSIKLCSNLLVKNVCTSDLLFEPGVTLSEARRASPACQGATPMPRDMAFPVPKGGKWHDHYDYIRFPPDGSSLPYDSIQRSCSSPVAGGHNSEEPLGQLPQPVTLTKAVRDRLSLVQQITSPKAMPHRCTAAAGSIPEVHLAAPEALRVGEQEAEDGMLRGMGDSVRSLAVSDGGIHVYAHQRSERAARATHAGSEEGVHRKGPGADAPASGRASRCRSFLPDPILKLRKVIGFGGCSTKWALWTRNSSAVVYPCHAVIVTLQIQTGEQRFFTGHTDKVSALAFNGSSTLLASAQEGPLGVLRLWDFPKGSCVAVFQTHVRAVLSLSFSYSGAILCGVGKDRHGKTMVVVWNTAQVTCGGEVLVLARAHTDVDIQTLKIAFFDDTRMVSCGRGSVRLWRVRNGALRSCPVNLGEYHTLEFTDLAFEEGSSAAREPDDRTLFVCSRSGHVLEVDYKNVCVRSARRLLPAQLQDGAGPGIAINSISISSSLCATGSADGYLRLWPLDFSAVVLEAEHEAPVSSVCISPDGHKVLCTTTARNLGYLDIQSRGYSTLMRSHEDSILAFSVEGVWKQMATVSRDNTIRVWDLVSMQQLYDFTAADEMPCAVSFHPTQRILACGFDSGVVRTFSLTASDLLAEHKQHRTRIAGLTFSPDGNFMFSSCLQGTLALYSCVAQKSQVLRVLGNVVAQDAGSGPDALVLSGDSCLLAFVGPSKYVVTVMEACSLDELLRVDISILDVNSTTLDSAVRICFAPVSQGELLVSTSSNKILVLDAKTGRLVREVSPVHKLSCSSLALSKDARYLLTAGDKVIKVWDYQMRFSINFQVYIGHSEPVCQVAFTPDQRHVVSVGDAIFLWDFLAVPAQGSPPALTRSSESPLLLAAEKSSEKLKDVSDVPRQTIPLPLLSSPPCLDVSPVHTAGCQSIFSESDREEEACLPGRAVENGDKDASVFVAEAARSEDLIVVRPKVRPESCRPAAPSAHEPRKETSSPQSQCCVRPDSYRHFTPHFKASVLPQSFLSPPAGNEVLKLKAVIGYNGNGRGNMVWDPDTGFFAYTCGCIIVVEDLHSGSQNHWLAHAEEISTLAVSHDAQALASASGKRDGDSHCQICIWNTQDGICTASLFHHKTQVQAMAYSQDDRFLATIGDYNDQTIALWSTYTYELLSSTRTSEPVHDMAFSPFSHREMACVGKGALTFWLLEQHGADINLKVHRAPAPEVLGPVELTSLCYGADTLLYSGTNSGQVCVWDTETNSCFMMWEADEGEIGVLVCRCNRLVSGSNAKRIRLWAVGATQELRPKGPKARPSSVLLEHEITLDGTIVSMAFDDSLEMGIVGTTAGTLWYINWKESTSIRLISGHKSKVTEVSFSPDETLCATCGEDGSVRVWSLSRMELVVQFQVLNQSCQCLAWKPHPNVAWEAESQHVVAGYSDGTIRVFSISRTEMELKMHPHATALTAIAYSTDGEMILSGGKDGIVAVSSPRTGMTIRILADHKGSAITVLQCIRKQYHDFGVQGAELWLATSSDRRVSVWASDWLKDKCELLDWLSFPAPASPEGHGSLPPSLAAFCPWEHGTLVYVGFGMQKEALFYSLRKKQVVEKISLPYFATSLSLCPAARFMAVGFSERLLRLQRCPAGLPQDYAAHDDAVHLCRFAPAGRRLLTASHSAVLVWELLGA